MCSSVFNEHTLCKERRQTIVSIQSIFLFLDIHSNLGFVYHHVETAVTDMNFYIFVMVWYK